jgi:LmbE family N-acetylglucosaminyl deacetylase
MPDPFNIVVISPHLDDAILSCGASIFEATRRNLRALIVTVFTADSPEKLSPFAAQLNEDMGAGRNVMELRREEDRRALKEVGAEFCHLDLPDACYRNAQESGHPLYPGIEDLFGPVHREDDFRIEELTTLLKPRLAEGEIWCPLGAGNHVDHKLIRRVIEADADFDRSWFYEEFPYARKRGAVRRARGAESKWEKRVLKTSPDALRSKGNAIREYASQVPLLFGNERVMRRRIMWYALRVGGERFWRRRSSA